MEKVEAEAEEETKRRASPMASPSASFAWTRQGQELGAHVE